MLVKKHNLRYLRNPDQYFNFWHFSLNGEVDDFNRFDEDKEKLLEDYQRSMVKDVKCEIKNKTFLKKLLSMSFFMDLFSCESWYRKYIGGRWELWNIKGTLIWYNCRENLRYYAGQPTTAKAIMVKAEEYLWNCEGCKNKMVHMYGKYNGNK